MWEYSSTWICSAVTTVDCMVRLSLLSHWLCSSGGGGEQTRTEALDDGPSVPSPPTVNIVVAI